MAKLLPFRFTKTLAPDARAKARLHVNELIKLWGEATPVDEDYYKTMFKIADKRKVICDDVYSVMVEFPNGVEAPTTVEEATNGKNFYEFGDFMSGLLKPLTYIIEHEQNVGGASYNSVCSLFEKNVKHEVEDLGNVALKPAQARLKLVERTKKSAPKATPSDTSETPKVEKPK